MILIDTNQVVISSYIKNVGNFSDIEPNPDIFRHMVLNSIRAIRTKFNKEKTVLAFDNQNYWRKQFYPHYKFLRKKDQKESKINWKAIFDSLAAFKAEAKEWLPYIVLDIENCEADDIIAILTKEFYNQEKITIISRDEDFVQLQKYSNVQQYSPIDKRMIVGDPKQSLLDLIVNGDRGDSIPNMLSPDNTFVESIRQKKMTKQRYADLINMIVENQFSTEELQQSYLRNKMLVDFDMIPDHIKDKILHAYEQYNPASRSKLLTYFIKYRLKDLTQSIGDF